MDAARSYRFTVGDIECIAVADGTLPYAADDLFVNAPKEQAERVVREHDLRPDEIPISYTGLVINTGRQHLLVDTGLGAGVAPGAGEMLNNLRAEGIRPEDIDTIILTHGTRTTSAVISVATGNHLSLMPATSCGKASWTSGPQRLPWASWRPGKCMAIRNWTE
jgi:hypothetical protein